MRALLALVWCLYRRMNLRQSRPGCISLLCRSAVSCSVPSVQAAIWNWLCPSGFLLQRAPVRSVMWTHLLYTSVRGERKWCGSLVWNIAQFQRGQGHLVFKHKIVRPVREVIGISCRYIFMCYLCVKPFKGYGFKPYQPWTPDTNSHIGVPANQLCSEYKLLFWSCSFIPHVQGICFGPWWLLVRTDQIRSWSNLRTPVHFIMSELSALHAAGPAGSIGE